MAALTTSILAGAAIIGTGTQIYGNIKANKAQAEAETANAAWYTEQAEFARIATNRELDLFRDQSEDFRANQVGAIARGGLTMSGSALAVMADTRLKQLKEEDAILADGAFKQKEALLKAGASTAQAERLSGFNANGLPAIGTALTSGVNIYTGLRKK